MTAEHSSYEELARGRRKSDEYRGVRGRLAVLFLIGQAVRERRLALGLSQVELAARAGLTQARPCPGWRQAGLCPRSRCWRRISAALDAEPDRGNRASRCLTCCRATWDPALRVWSQWRPPFRARDGGAGSPCWVPRRPAPSRERVSAWCSEFISASTSAKCGPPQAPGGPPRRPRSDASTVRLIILLDEGGGDSPRCPPPPGRGRRPRSGPWRTRASSRSRQWRVPGRGELDRQGPPGPARSASRGLQDVGPVSGQQET